MKKLRESNLRNPINIKEERKGIGIMPPEIVDNILDRYEYIPDKIDIRGYQADESYRRKQKALKVQETFDEDFKKFMTYIGQIRDNKLDTAVRIFEKNKGSIIRWLVHHMEANALILFFDQWATAINNPKAKKAQKIPWQKHFFIQVFPQVLAERHDLLPRCQTTAKIAYTIYPDIWKPFLIPDPEESETP